MKKLLVSLTLVLALSLCACGGNSGSDDKGKGKAPASETNTAKTLNPINLCDGKLYGGMPMKDVVEYLEGQLELGDRKFVDSGEFCHAFYTADDWYGLGETVLDVQFKDDKLKYVEFLFRQTTNDELIAEISNRFGSDYETKEYSTYEKHTWSFSDAFSTVMAYDEERDTISFFVTYFDENMQ